MPAQFEAKEERIRPVVMTVKPAFNASTQKVVQTGWTVLSSEVNPIWSVVSLSPSELQALQQEANFSQLDNWIATFEAGTATGAQVQTAMARVLKELKRLRGTS